VNTQRSLPWLALGVRLSVRGGPRAWVRVAGVVVGAFIAVLAIQLALSVPLALDARSQRLEARAPRVTDSAPTGRFAETRDLAGSATISRRLIDILPSGTLPPGVEVAPAPGEAVVSPALARAIVNDGSGPLSQRYPGWDRYPQVSRAGLAGPEELVAYVGMDASTSQDPNQFGRVMAVSGWGSGSSPVELESGLSRLREGSMMLAFLLVVIVAAFVVVSVRSVAEDQERQVAALRLAGASRRTARTVIIGEVIFIVSLGSLLGAIAWVALVQIVGDVQLVGTGWFRGDVPVGPTTLIGFAFVPIVAVMVALLTGRGGTEQSLRIARRGQVRLRTAPAILVVAVSAASLLVVGQAQTLGWSPTSPQRSAVLVIGLIAMLGALVIGLPAVMRSAAALVRRFVHTLTSLVSGAWVANNARLASRAILVVSAVLIFSGGLLSWNVAEATTIASHAAPADVLLDATVRVDSNVPELASKLAGVDGVLAAQSVRSVHVTVGGADRTAVIADCSQLLRELNGTGECGAGLTAMRNPDGGSRIICDMSGHCSPVVAPVTGDVVATDPTAVLRTQQPLRFPASRVEIRMNSLLPAVMDSVLILDPELFADYPHGRGETAITLVLTDGSRSSESRIRTAAMQLDPAAKVTSTESEFRAASASVVPMQRFMVLAELVLLALALSTTLIALLATSSHWERSLSALKILGLRRGAQTRVIGALVALICGVGVSFGLGFSVLLFRALNRVLGVAAPIPSVLVLGSLVLLVVAVVLAIGLASLSGRVAERTVGRTLE